MRILRSLVRYPPLKRQRIVWATLVVVAVRLLLWIAPFRLVRRAVDAVGRGPKSRTVAEEAELRDIVEAVIIASRHIPQASCLTQALAAQVLLSRRGYRTAVRYGVSKGPDGNLVAHAWLEFGGEVILGGPATHVERFTRLRGIQEHG